MGPRTSHSWLALVLVPIATSALGTSDDSVSLAGLQFIDPFTHEAAEMGDVNPGTVEGFELLYASPGIRDIAEIAGHIVLRVKLRNNPLAAATGLENPNDLVISFLADTAVDEPPKVTNDRWPNDKLVPFRCVEDRTTDVGRFDPLAATLQALKGLTGGYRTTFDRSTLFSTIKRYTLDSDRDLIRYRLKVSETQKTSLLRRLQAAQAGEQPPYFFFDRNCASILVRIIGEGVGDVEVAKLDAVALPPNALLALLERRRLIEAVGTDFPSYKRVAQQAGDAISAILKAMSSRRRELRWPTAKELLNGDEVTRNRAYFHLALIAKHDPSLSPEISRIMLAAPAAERMHLDKHMACLDYTSQAAATSRQVRRSGMVAWAGMVDLPVVPQSRRSEGSLHTGLTSAESGLAVMGDGGTLGQVSARIYRQEMGSLSLQRMQSATSIRFGEVSLSVGDHRMDATSPVRHWNVTVMELRKFSEGARGVARIGESLGALGYGFKILTVDGDAEHGSIDGTIVGIEALANLASSADHGRFIHAGVGTGIVTVADRAAVVDESTRPISGYGAPSPGISTGFRLDGLLTIDAGRRWQLRTSAEATTTWLESEQVRGRLMTGGVTYRHGSLLGSDLYWHARAQERARRRDGLRSVRTSSLELGLEVQPR